MDDEGRRTMGDRDLSWVGTAIRDTTRSRTGGLWVGSILSAVVLAFLLVFILQNRAPVQIAFLGWAGQLLTGVALLFAAVAVCCRWRPPEASASSNCAGQPPGAVLAQAGPTSRHRTGRATLIAGLPLGAARYPPETGVVGLREPVDFDGRPLRGRGEIACTCARHTCRSARGVGVRGGS